MTTTVVGAALSGVHQPAHAGEHPTPPDLRLVTDSAADSVSVAEFADAMSARPNGVALVTSWVGDRPWGVTVTSFASLSAEPPMVLVSLGSRTASAAAITATRRFGVSILAADQVALARFGSVPGAAKFLESYVEARAGRSASPVIAGALAHLDCTLYQEVRIADHTVFVGRVRTVRASHGGAPLVYHRRAYRTLADSAASAAA